MRVGARGDVHQPVVVDFRNSRWKFQPTQHRRRPGNAALPGDVRQHPDRRRPTTRVNQIGAADLKVASFNVLNYFTDPR